MSDIVERLKFEIENDSPLPGMMFVESEECISEITRLRAELQIAQSILGRKLVEFCADKAALVEALEWYVDHDDAGPNDEYHLAGLERARSTLAQAKAGEP